MFRSRTLCGHLPRRAAAWPWPPRRCSTGCWATCSRTPRSTRRLGRHRHLRLARRAIAPTSPSPTTGRASRRRGGSASSSPSCASTTRRAAPGIGLFAARHLARTMGGELTVEPREPYGSQFVLAPQRSWASTASRHRCLARETERPTARRRASTSCRDSRRPASVEARGSSGGPLRGPARPAEESAPDRRERSGGDTDRLTLGGQGRGRRRMPGARRARRDG